MKTLLASVALAAATLTGASAAMADVSQTAQVTIERYVPGVDLTQFSDAQVQSILAAINSGDSAGDKESQVRALVRAYR